MTEWIGSDVTASWEGASNALTFLNLIDECERGIKYYGGSKIDLVKHMINMVYLNEMLVVDNLYSLHWLIDFDDTVASKAPSVISAITQADPGVITTEEAHGKAVDDIVSIYDITGMTELNNRMFAVNSVPSTTNLTLIDIDGLDAIDTSGLTAYSSGGVINQRGTLLNPSGKNIQRILECKWHGEDRMTEITREELEETTIWWDSATARPERYYHRKKYSAAGGENNHLLWFYAADAAYDLRYWYEMQPTKLINNTDVP
ncbi:MAG: hypothetical protein KAS32_01045, partial [Candidatus Peribacteraceae bacterium]|nr:hypothetical protein [Candidatus Peribacteraceae bacterium]